jgi:hypothetical protein
MCTWCRRYRVCVLRTWRSPRSGAQLCAEVCEHCWRGGADDACRTCVRRTERAAEAPRQTGVRPLGQADALELLKQLMPKKRRGA